LDHAGEAADQINSCDVTRELTASECQKRALARRARDPETLLQPGRTRPGAGPSIGTATVIREAEIF